jgi:2-polyprenyl-6-hydroxyphenyl methylase/3-demethylubiquinone-9 3-methyltransferase
VNVDGAELAKFEASAAAFWDLRGEFRPLHLLNPVRLQFIAERTALAGSRVLDVGCGGGLLAEALARAGARVTAIDLAPAMIEVARLHAAESALAVDYRLSSAEEVAAAEPAMTVTLAQLLRPGGALFVSTINRNLRSFLLAIVGAEYLLNLIPRGTHEYERLIRPAELARWARAAGLTLSAMTGIDLNPFTERVALSRNVSVNYLAHFQR